MKKLAIVLTLLLATSLVAAFSFDDTINNFFSMSPYEWFTGFVVQQYDAKCVNKEITITTTRTAIKPIEVSMLNTEKKWKSHEVGLAFKNYGLDISGGQTENVRKVYKGEQADFSFDIIPTYYGTEDQDLVIEYQLQRLNGLATKTQKSRRFGETCYIYVKVK